MKTKEKGVYKYCLDSTGEQYTGFFQTKEEAFIWYGKHGKWLEKQFDRKLVLKNQAEENKIAKDMIQRELLKANKKRKTQLLKLKHDAKRSKSN